MLEAFCLRTLGIEPNAQRLFEHFHVDPDEFHSRHEMLVSSFERGKITLDDYLERTIFYRERSFAIAGIPRLHVYALGAVSRRVEVRPGVEQLEQILHGNDQRRARELNDYRIEKFGLKSIFRVFVSSCFVGLRKPERDIYRLALELTQMPADQYCFIDDQTLNLESAAKMGMHTIEMKNADQLRSELEKLGVSP